MPAKRKTTRSIGSNWKLNWKLLKHCYNVPLVPTGNSTGKYYNTGGGNHNYSRQCQALAFHSERRGHCKLIGHGFGPPQKERRITSSSITFRWSLEKAIHSLTTCCGIAEADASFTFKHHEGCIQKDIQQQFSTAPIGNSVHVYPVSWREAPQDKNPAENLRARISNHVLHNKKGYGKDTISHHKGRWGHQRLHGYSQTSSPTHVPLSRGESQTKQYLTPIVVRDRDPAETQRPLGPVHTQKEAE
jgi:hypothetical protein